MAIRLARETHNDYLPELEAVSGDEMNLLFGSNRPQLARLRVGEVLKNTFRYLGVVRAGETFTYLPAWIPTSRPSWPRNPLPSAGSNRTERGSAGSV